MIPGMANCSPCRWCPTTPPSFTGNNTGAEVVVVPLGRFVYGSNREHDSIAIFAVDRGRGSLTPVGWSRLKVSRVCFSIGGS
jgi:6-phosphogluconolactonase